MKNTISLLTLALSTSMAYAGDLIVGIGYDDVFDQTDTQSGALILEYHADPFYEGSSARYALGGALQVDGDSDTFIGVGVAATWRVGDGPWFIEGSFMPGYYDQGSDGTPLDGNLQFRTLLGLGYELSETRRVSLAIDHKSNADIEDTNPGSETIMLRYSVSF